MTCNEIFNANHPDTFGENVQIEINAKGKNEKQGGGRVKITSSTGNIISELRREAGYTQKTLAKALNVTDKAVSKWERGICLPDVSLLSKISLLLDVDIELLLSKDNGNYAENWVALLDLQDSTFDLSQVMYDKPAVYYLLSHFLLLGITDVYVRTTPENEGYLQSGEFASLGFNFVFGFHDLPQNNLMIMNKPYFFFGSDLTRLFQSAMITDTITKSSLQSSQTPFLFCPAEYSFMYQKNPEYLYKVAVDKNFGRGMICIEMGEPDANSDVANFVKMYQNNSGMLISSLEEIAFKKGLISLEKLKELSLGKSYRIILLNSLKTE